MAAMVNSTDFLSSLKKMEELRFRCLTKIIQEQIEEFFNTNLKMGFHSMQEQKKRG